MRLLVVYGPCSVGGVERVILNRVEAFRSAGMHIAIDMVFLEDLGGFEPFRRYIQSLQLTNFIKIDLLNGDFPGQYRFEEYDMVFNIDTPSLFPHFERCPNFYVECHTAYKKSRAYLKTLPKNVKAIIVPSRVFGEEIRPDVPASLDIVVLPNSISQMFFDKNPKKEKVIFGKKPLAYMARFDDLKNIKEALNIFELLKARDDLMFVMVGRGLEESPTDEGFATKLKNSGLLGRSFLRSWIPYDRVTDFFGILRAHKGVFLSPSKGESYGITVAESISSGVPAVVSDIPPHRELLGSNVDFLYQLGNIREARDKIESILNDWDGFSRKIQQYQEPLKYASFIEGWRHLVSSFHEPVVS
jgi:glycosyltransferase involved in cell wall biosynthesis